MPQDSTNKNIRIGSIVRFRGKEYTIESFYYEHSDSLAQILFEEKQHTDEVADEMSVDLVRY